MLSRKRSSACISASAKSIAFRRATNRSRTSVWDVLVATAANLVGEVEVIVELRQDRVEFAYLAVEHLK